MLAREISKNPARRIEIVQLQQFKLQKSGHNTSLRPRPGRPFLSQTQDM